MNGGTDFGNGHGLGTFAVLKCSTHGILFFRLRFRRVRAAALATAAGFLARTAPHQKHDRNYNNNQGKELPFHAANITANANRATAFFLRHIG